jgi:hypothetical protein
LGNLAAFRSLLGDRALYRTLAKRNAAANGCSGKVLHDALQKYFTIHCERRVFLARPSGFRTNNAQPEGLALAAVEPYMSVANYISENRINPE